MLRIPDLHYLFALVLTLLLVACTSPKPAPVVDRRPPVPHQTEQKPESKPAAESGKPEENPKLYTVQKGDTLISIALQHGLDYRELAAWNNLENINLIRVGQDLRIVAPDAGPAAPAPTAAPVAAGSPAPQPGQPVVTPLGASPPPPVETYNGQNSATFKVEPRATRIPYSDTAYTKALADAAAIAPTPTPPVAAVTPTVTAPASAPSVPVTTAPISASSGSGDEGVEWSWPIQPKGKILSTFTDLTKGIDIAGTRGMPVLAAANGKVVYNGTGLRGYGRLIIIKHTNIWLSAYAHNEKVLVMEGQEVKKGQKIAEMGSSDTDKVKLHFEIRKQGKPVDPLKFLPPA